MAEPTAVLSYTRKDDEFFGGYITAFRKTLESAVHVVTGREDFRIFQDVEGIVIGEQWQKKLAEVIGQANFLVPMVSPLFFNSGPCREEVELFLAHERGMQRDDLILPVYFLSSPKLEKDEEKGKDPIATELARRQMFDWREKANLPLQEPAARSAMLSLASAVAAAIERVEAAPGTRSVEGRAARAERTRVEQLPAALEHGEAHREMPSERVILWVDDNPDNNRWERRALEPYGVRFELATDTDEAMRRLDARPVAAIISDMGRRGDAEAGYTLLAQVRAAGITVPYFIYSSSRAPRHVRTAIARGAHGATNDPGELVQMVLGAIG